MNPLKQLFGSRQRKEASKSLFSDSSNSFQNSLNYDDEFSKFNIEPFNETYLCNAWVNIAVNILIRNIARADFILERDGVELKSGSLFSLFHKPNEQLSRYDLWDIPELQENEDAQSKRDIAEINAGLKTINDVLKERGKEPKPWGDQWYRPQNLKPTGGSV